MGVYLDYNASAPIDPRVLDTMIDIYRNVIGNADSRTHDYGDKARNVVEIARKQIASLLEINSTEVFFTSGATESNNIAIQGLWDYAQESGKKHIVTTSIEHKAVLETIKAMSARGFEVEYMAPDESGCVNAAELLKHVRDDTLLVSVMHVNNETGMIQPVQEIGEALATQNILFHVDATQSCGKLVDELRHLKYNMLSFSAHKLRGPQGVGVLVLRKRSYKLPPIRGIMYGGQQEHGIRPGTIPVALVGGCGKACEIAQNEFVENNGKAQKIRQMLLELLDSSGVSYSLNGDQTRCICSTMNICFHGVSSEALMISARQYCAVSNGSACTSKIYSPSYVLTAMGMPIEQIENSIRVSWGADTDQAVASIEFKNLLGIVKSISL